MSGPHDIAGSEKGHPREAGEDMQEEELMQEAPLRMGGASVGRIDRTGLGNMLGLFIGRPVGVTLLTLAIALLGFVGYSLLPVSPLPQVDFPTIQVQARLPGASPETMASTVATPLERALGRIAGITEMTSDSTLGQSNIILQFDLDRDINGAARDVQAAINAARATLPTLPSNPTYRKLNPADMPIMVLALTSDILPVDVLFDVASSVLGQKISQLEGVGQVRVGGGSLPSVRVNVVPGLLNSQSISLSEIRQTLATANANLPKGMVDNNETLWFVGANDQLKTAEEFAPLVLRRSNGVTTRLSDIAYVTDGVESVRNAGYANSKRSVILIIYREPGANIIETVRRVRDTMPLLRRWMPENADLMVTVDRSPSITTSVKEVERNLIISICLVVFVVFLFLRNGRATLIPAVAVPVSLLGTFCVMYLCGFSLNHLSLMALTVATGFVVDDAIVVTENIVRHMENGAPPLQAAQTGSREVYFTVMSISISLVAIFIPILGMTDMVGRLFREFSITLSVAVLVSLLVSLISTPMLCAHLLRPTRPTTVTKAFEKTPTFVLGGVLGSFSRAGRRILRMWGNFLDLMFKSYARTLGLALKHRNITMLCLLATIGLNVALYITIPKGFFPEQDTGQLLGEIRADQSISFQAMRPKFLDMMHLVQNHPDVLSVAGFTGGGRRNSGRCFITLKPLRERKRSTRAIMDEMRVLLKDIPGAQLTMVPMQDIRSGGRTARAAYQYTLQSDNLDLLREWTPKVVRSLRTLPGVVDINSDQDERGLQTTLTVNRDALARYGISFRQFDTTLGLAFGQSFASTIFSGINQYRVVLEFAEEYLDGPDGLFYIYVPSSLGAGAAQSVAVGRTGNTSSSFATDGIGGTLVPLTALAEVSSTLTSLGVSHQGQFSAATISFNLADGHALSDVQNAIEKAMTELHVPSDIRGSFQGTARLAAGTMGQLPLLILAALVTLYIVLGVLYESLIHPLTILSTLPSAGVGALLGLMAFNAQFTVIAFIGVLLLCGIVKKNAILMVDFAIVARREEGLTAEQAIHKACLLRFRPIMMTTMAAIFGALPLLFSSGEGSELRSPLGITIVGGLIVSQILTLYTTPVVYLFLDRFATQPEDRPAYAFEQEEKKRLAEQVEQAEQAT